MTSPLHISLLEKLKKAGIGVMVDVSPFIDFHFHKPENPDHRKQAMRPPILFLRDLIKNEYIRLEEGDEYFNVIMHPHNTFIKWFSDIDIQVYITSKGLDYLDEYKNNRLVNNTNRAIIICSVTTFILSAVIVLYTVLNYNLSKESFNYAKKNDSTLKTVESRLDIISKKQLKH